MLESMVVDEEMVGTMAKKTPIKAIAGSGATSPKVVVFGATIEGVDVDAASVANVANDTNGAATMVGGTCIITTTTKTHERSK